MNNPEFDRLVGGLAFLLSIAVLSYIAVTTRSEVAIGGIIAVAAAGNGFFMRGRTTPPAP